jgi:hypothetical protein
MDDAAVTAAAIQRLQEHRQRLIADKVARGEAVLRPDPMIIITGTPCTR